MNKLEQATRDIGNILHNQVRPMFKDEGNPRFTLIVRFDNPDHDVVVTNDTPEGVKAVVERRLVDDQPVIEV